MTDIYPTYSSEGVFYKTYELTKAIKLDGAIVECGVAAGSNFAQMIKATIDSNIKRDYYGFDSFEGIPYATKEDEQQPGIGEMNLNKLGVLESTGVSSHSIEGVKENLTKWGVWNDNVYLIKGWFQDTLPNNTIESISVLRLDADLYESTKIALQYLYPKVQKGGLIIIDDWELAGCQKAVKEFIKHKRIKLNYFEYIAYWYK